MSEIINVLTNIAANTNPLMFVMQCVYISEEEYKEIPTLSGSDSAVIASTGLYPTYAG